MGLQKKYYTILCDYAEKYLNNNFDAVVQRLGDLSQYNNPEEYLTDNEWPYFKQVLRSPRPYYLLPLDEYSKKYLIETSNFKNDSFQNIKIKKKSLIFKAKNLEISSNISVSNSQNVQNIMNAFGLSR